MKTRRTTRDSDAAAATVGAGRSCWAKMRWMTEAQRLNARIVSLLDNRHGIREVLTDIISSLRSVTGLDAIGIRLRDGDDFPYFVTTGFPPEFVDAEASIRARDSDGTVIRDQYGNPSLGCLCGQVLRGAVDSSLPFFTQSGSFWTNSTSEFSRIAEDHNVRLRPDFRCKAQGYECLALIPLHSDSQVVGLLQLNDHRKDSLFSELLVFLESLGACMGTVLASVSQAEAKQQSGKRLDTEIETLVVDLSESRARITEEMLRRKRAEEALNQAQNEIERQVNERTRELTEENRKLLGGIAKRHASREYLKASEEIFRKFYERSPIGIQLFNAAGKLVRANQACMDILGVSDFADINGLDLFKDAQLPEDAKAVVLTGQTARYEIWFDPGAAKFFKSKKAGGMYLDVLINPFADTPEGEPLPGYLVHLQDITERKCAEEALRLSESRFREIYENSAVMMHSVNKGGYILNVNKKWLQELGYTREEVVGRRLDLIMTPESAEKIFAAIFPSFWQNGKVSDVSYQYVKKDGTVIDVLLDSTVMEDPIWGLISLSVIRDVTDRTAAERALLQSEERFRAIFEGAKDCIFIKDRALTYTHANPAMEKLLGLSMGELFVLGAEDLYGEEAGKHIREVDLRVLAGESIEEEHTRPVNGADLTFHDVRIPLRNSRGQIIGLCGISRNITERKKAAPVSRIVPVDYPSDAMKSTFSKARYAAATDSIILLLGESGSGKDYLARWIHDKSKRVKGPFFSINCAAVPHELAESELFGHEAGAFTGARGRKRGLLELAEGGTLLLNEIGELSLPLQSKLLTFLDTRSFPRVGGEKSISVNARLMAATHRDLEEEVSKGRFLQSLFYRLNVFAIRVPPLRERSKDIPLLIREIISRLAVEMQLLEIPELDAAALNALAGYSWPGNVRELRNVLERALMLAQDGNLALSLPKLNGGSEDWSFVMTFPKDRSLHDVIDEIIHSLCSEALRRSGGSKKSAARLLRISRDSFYRYTRNCSSGRDVITRK
jgi:two-component system, NtrC family, response regulator AtoC